MMTLRIIRLVLALALTTVAFIGIHNHHYAAYAGSKGCSGGTISRGPSQMETSWGAFVNLRSVSVQNYDCTVTPVSVSIQQSSGNVYYWTTKDAFGNSYTAYSETGSSILAETVASPNCGNLPQASSGQWLTFTFTNAKRASSNIMSGVEVSAIKCSGSDINGVSIQAY